MIAKTTIKALGREAQFLVPFLWVTLCVALPAVAQAPLSLSDAIARARARNPDVISTAVAEREAAERVTQARSGYFPRVDVVESWQRGNHPVFVFSSLLAQRGFTLNDFSVDALNHPGALDHFRAAISVEQSLFDRTTAANVRAASIGYGIAATIHADSLDEYAEPLTDVDGRASRSRRPRLLRGAYEGIINERHDDSEEACRPRLPLLSNNRGDR